MWPSKCFGKAVRNGRLNFIEALRLHSDTIDLLNKELRVKIIPPSLDWGTFAKFYRALAACAPRRFLLQPLPFYHR